MIHGAPIGSVDAAALADKCFEASQPLLPKTSDKVYLGKTLIRGPIDSFSLSNGHECNLMLTDPTEY
jgi:hypothetical protein